jgi:uncharacterized delta-60 repeat protein
MKPTLRKLQSACLLAALLSIPAATRAETAVQAWVQRYNGTGNGDDYVHGMAVDGSNNVIVTGSSIGIGSGYDYATIKYSSTGVPLWTNRYNGPAYGGDTANAVAVDSSNNVIITGTSSASASGQDYATIKYSSAGVPLWTNRYNGPGNSSDAATAVTVDHSNNVIVTGGSTGSGGNNDYATIKYSSDGVPLWTNRYNGPGNSSEYPNAVVVDGSNSVIVTGYSTGSGSGYDYATIKYSSAGEPLWTNRYSSPGDTSDQANAVAVDSNNDVLVTGTSGGYGNGADYATIKYSSAGEPLWTNLYNGPGSGYDSALSVGADSNNNVIVTGASTGSGNSDYATIKYSSAGEPLWTNRYNGPGNGSDQANAVAVDGSNNVIVTGASAGSGSGNDYATIKYSSAGEPLWTTRYNGPGNGGDFPYRVAVDHSANVIISGSSPGSTSGSDFATIKYICVPSPVMAAYQLTSGTFQMQVDNVLQPGTLVIEVCTNLTAWAPVFTNTTLTNVVYYTDPSAGSAAPRFYRAYQFP